MEIFYNKNSTEMKSVFYITKEEAADRLFKE